MALNYWLDNKYTFDSNVIIVFALFIMVNALYYVCWIFLNLTGKHTNLSYVVFVEIGLNMLLSYWLSKELGLLGIALGTLIASACTSAWFAYYECHYYFKTKSIL
jgi:O-antigen/teichoic acid export membrane protein